jgi:hypothetical protein
VALAACLGLLLGLTTTAAAKTRVTGITGVNGDRDVTATVRITSAPRGARVVLQSRVGTAARVRDTSSVARGGVRLVWRVPVAFKTVSVRVVVLDGRKRVVAVTRWTTIAVPERPRAAGVAAGRRPAEVSLYLGLATAIATFSAAAVALGLLDCSSMRQRIEASGVLLCATLGVATAFATIARARTTGAGNVLIGAGLVAAAVSVLTRALRRIFTLHDETGGSPSFPTASSATPAVHVTLPTPAEQHEPHDKQNRVGGLAPPRSPRPAVLCRELWIAKATFVAISAAAAAVALPDLLPDILHSRPVGTSAAVTQVSAGSPAAVVPQRLAIKRTLDRFARSISVQAATALAETLSPDVARTSSETHLVCASGRGAVLAYYQRVAFVRLTVVTLPNLRADRIPPPTRGHVLVHLRASVNGRQGGIFTFRLRRIGAAWKISEIEAPRC